jgi:hypothetical protein
MKKWMAFAGIALVLAAAGASAAFLQTRDSAPAPLTALAPITPAEAAVSAAGGSSAGCSCCSGPAAGTAPSNGRAAQIEAYLTDFYTGILGAGVTVEVQDLGCHHEASILQNGRIVKRLSINGNAVTDIT